MSFSDVVRKEFKASDTERDKGLTTPDGVVRYDDICYCEDKDRACKDNDWNVEEREDIDEMNRWHLLDVYRPESAGNSRLPVIVNVHGGGWVYGDKDVYQYYCMDLCLRGFVVVNFSYRLAPEYKFPAQLEDTNMVFGWIHNHAEEYGFDTDRIYAVGDSAGANILGLYCLMCTNREYASKYEFRVSYGHDDSEWKEENTGRRLKENEDDRVNNYVPRAIALNCGTYNLALGKRGMKGFLSELMPHQGTSDEIDMLNVTKYINKDFPPTFLMTCYGDFLMNQAPLLEDKLKELGITYINKLYGSEEEPLKHVFNCDIRMEEAKVCNDETCEFFQKIG